MNQPLQRVALSIFIFAMKKTDLRSQTIEELWALHEEIAAILSAKMAAEKLKLEQRLKQIE